MEPIKIEVTIGVNVDLSQGSKDFLLKILERKLAVTSLLSSLSAFYPAPTNTVSMTPPPAQSSASAGNAPEPEAPQEKVEQPEPEAPQEKVEQPAPSKETKAQPGAATVTIEDVRKVLAEKVNSHRNTKKCLIS